MSVFKIIKNRIIQKVKKKSLIEFFDSYKFDSGLGDSAWLLYGLTRSIKPKIVVEIGAAKGKSTCIFGLALKHNNNGQLISIDPHTSTKWNDHDSVNTYDILIGNLKKFDIEKQVTVKKGLSNDIIKGWVYGKIDLILIDGDHSYKGVENDFLEFSKFFHEETIIIFHDTGWVYNKKSKWYREDMGVPVFVEELRKQGLPIITIFKNYGVSIVQYKLNGIPLTGSE
jgi:predicted O-methyltransferase YrrM